MSDPLWAELEALDARDAVIRAIALASLRGQDLPDELIQAALNAGLSVTRTGKPRRRTDAEVE